MFNLRKFSEKSVEPINVALESQRESNDKTGGSYNDLLEKVRKNDEDAKVVSIDGELDGIRKDDVSAELTEAQLENHKPGKDMAKRTGYDSHDQLPINLLHEVNHQEKVKAYNGSTVKDKSTEFWDEFLTSADVRPTPSQLQNHPDRFRNLSEDDVLKNQGVRDMVMASLKDADAVLYHIYRVAASEDRNLTQKETKLVDGITADKIRIVQTLVAK